MKMSWHTQVGNQRDWLWRGWKIHYSFEPVSLDSVHLDIPLILLHGFGASIGHWRYNIPILKEKHTVYSLDLLGFGASQKAHTSYQIQLWADLVYDFWRTFINQPIVLVGNSIGSLTALLVAVTHPQIVKGLVMLGLPDISQRQQMIPQWLQPIVRSVENLVASPLAIRIIFYLVRHPSVIRRWLKLAYANQVAVNDELVEIIATPPQAQGAARTLIALTKSVNQRDFSPPTSQLLSQIDSPTLLIWGSCDRFIPSSLGLKLARVNSKIELKLLDGVGHCPHDEVPEVFNQLLLDWLSNNVSPS